MVDKEKQSLTITDILNNVLSTDKLVREDSQNKLQQLALNNFPEFLYNLGSELSDESKPVKIRQIAAVYLKNSIVNSNELRDIWLNKLDPNAKDHIKSLVLATLATNFKEVRKAAGIVIAGICKVDLPLNEKWPELINSLCQSAFNENLNIKLAALESLGYVCEELTPKTIDTASVDSILSAIIQNFSTSVEFAKTSLKAFFHTIKLAEKNFSTKNELHIIMESIFAAGNIYSNYDEVLEKIAQIFIEIASLSNYYDYIYDYIQKIAEFTFYILKNKSESNEKLALLAFEFWCSLGDEEVQRFKNEYTFNMSQITIQNNSLITIPNPNQNTSKLHKKYFSSYYPQLIEIILQFVSPVEEEEEEDSADWSMSKASLYVLYILVQVIDSQMMEKIIKYIDNNISCEDTKVKNISLLLFAGCCNTMQHRSRINDIISKHLNKVLKLLFNESLMIKKSSSLLLIKITKHYGKSGIFDSFNLNSTIPLLINVFPSNSNKIVINVIQSLINLTKALGDLDTNKSTNIISPFFEKIFSELILIAYREGAFNKDANLTMYCFLLINDLIEYSSHDKQEKLTEILIYFLTQFEGSLTNTGNPTFNTMCTPGTSDIIYQLQSYYCTVFRVVFKKLFKKINAEMGLKIFTLLENSFKMRQTVYDEAVLCLGSLASNMGEPFEEIMNKFQDFLLYALEKYNESSLCKSAIITLGHIVRSIKFNFYKFSDKYIPVLINILTNQDVSRNNKILAITTLGEICMTINEHFLNHLDNVMQVFFSAAQIATTIAESDDEDTDEYLKDLRFELIEAFTCISFGLDDCGKKNLFVPFVPHIFNFFKTIVGDAYSQRSDILKSMLAFITDMANSYGKEIASICDKEFIRKVITKLRNFKIKKYESDIIQQEQILNLIV